MLTALPLFWGAGTFADELSGKSAPPPLIARLSVGRKLIPLDTAKAEALAGARNLLLIQPQLLPPEELVALDAWVRQGGRVVVLADPDLHWAAGFTPGDPRLPPPSTLLDPLFAHWGLRLDGMRGPSLEQPGALGENTVRYRNRGRWVLTGKSCQLHDDAVRASCIIGKGQAEIIADADFADPAGDTPFAQDGATALDQLMQKIEMR